MHRDVKPPILSCFGDIALAIQGNFEPYMAVTLMVLDQACAMSADPVRWMRRSEEANFSWSSVVTITVHAFRRIQNDYDMVDYVNSLREGILEAYTGIVQGLKADGKSALLVPYLESVFKLLHAIAMDSTNRTDAVTRGAIGLLG